MKDATPKEPRKPIKIGPIEKTVPPPDATGFEAIRTLVGAMKDGESVFVENCTEGLRSMFYKAGKAHGSHTAALMEKTEATETAPARVGIRFWRLKEKPARKYAAAIKALAKPPEPPAE